VFVPLPGISARSCSALTPGRSKASALTPARGNSEALTPGNDDAFGGVFVVGAHAGESGGSWGDVVRGSDGDVCAGVDALLESESVDEPRADDPNSCSGV